MKEIRELMDYIAHSPTAFHAIEASKKELAGFRELKEKDPENPQYIDDTVVALFFCWKISRDERYRQEALEITRQHPELPLCGAFSRLF